MKYKLINEPNKNLGTVEQILYNRGIKLEDIPHYMHLSDNDINDYRLFGEERLKKGLQLLTKAIKNNSKAIIIVDCDCDGYTSAAILINYLHQLFPTWVENNLEYYMHSGKQHGLKDCISYILQGQYSLVICPDSGSNDYSEHEVLQKHNIDILILDHHLADIPKNYDKAVIINNNANYEV